MSRPLFTISLTAQRLLALALVGALVLGAMAASAGAPSISPGQTTLTDNGIATPALNVTDIVIGGNIWFNSTSVTNLDLNTGNLTDHDPKSHLSSIVYIQGATVTARHSNGTLISSGTNATTVIQAALNAGGAVAVAPGNYTIPSTITLNSGNKLIGAGQNTTNLLIAPSTSIGILLTGAADRAGATTTIDVTVARMTLSGNKYNTGSGDLIKGKFSQSRFEDLTLRQSDGYGIFLQSPAPSSSYAPTIEPENLLKSLRIYDVDEWAIFLERADQYLEGLLIYNNNNGIKLQSTGNFLLNTHLYRNRYTQLATCGSNHFISNVEVENGEAGYSDDGVNVCVGAKNIRFSNLYVFGNDNGIHLASTSTSTPIQDIIFTNCIVRDNEYGVTMDTTGGGNIQNTTYLGCVVKDSTIADWRKVGSGAISSTIRLDHTTGLDTPTVYRNGTGNYLTLRGAENAGNGAQVILTGKDNSNAAKVIVRTPRADGATERDRLVITGVAETASAQWQNILHEGLKLGDNLNLNGYKLYASTNSDTTWTALYGGSTAGSGGQIVATGTGNTNPGQVILRTPAADGTTETTRLTLSGNAATATATWANTDHLGLRLGADLVTNGFGVTGLDGLALASYLQTPLVNRSVTSSFVTLTGGSAAGNGGQITLTGTANGGNPGRILLRTPAADGTTETTRLTLSGNAATATATWANTEHVGLKAGGNLDMNSNTLTNLATLTAATSLTTGAVKLTDTALETCDSTVRGTMRYVNGGLGGADTIQACMKSAADTYSWKTIVTG